MYQQQINIHVLFARIVVLILLLSFLQASCAFVCQEGFCDNVDCSQFPTNDNCNGALSPNSSVCGCCPTCYHYIEDGGECSVLLQSLLGPPSDHSYHCKHPLSCIEGKCKQDPELLAIE